MKKLLLMPLVLGALVLTPVLQAAGENETLGDVMYLLLDQVGGLGTVANGTLNFGDAEKDARGFSRAVHRCTGALYLLKLIDSRKGSIDAAGNLVKDELTPSTFVGKSGPVLDKTLKDFSTALNKVGGVFESLKAELESQAKKAVADRKNSTLRLRMADLDSAIKEAHKAFKPQP